MKRSEIIDYIKSYAVKFMWGNLTSYETVTATADLINEDIPAWQNIKEVIATSGTPAGIPITIPATSTYPYNIPVTDFPTITSLRPSVRQVIAGASDTQDTNEGANQLCRYNFTDNTKTELASIDVLTTTNDGTTVAVDTYIVINQ